MSAADAATLREAKCRHCSSSVPPGAENAAFCCRGCEAVHSLLMEQGLGRYYELARGDVAPATSAEAPKSHLWLEALLAERPAVDDGQLCPLQLDVQGIHCAACVWLMNETFRRKDGAARITINPSLGKVALLFKPGFDVLAWVKEIEAFGYQFGPPRKEPRKQSLELPLRMGVSIALTINVMLFSVSFYFGLAPDEPEVFTLFSRLSFALSSAVVVVGGWPFFRAAYQGLKRRVLHLDFPIAVGIALVYGASVAQVLIGAGGDLTYFDTLNTFITLMLVGRWLQERVIERNRRFLLDDDGAEGLMARVVVGERLVAKPAPKLASGDLLLVAPSELVPVDAVLQDELARISTDWMTGESSSRPLRRGARIPAGSFNAGKTALHALAVQPFGDSPLVSLLRQVPAEAKAGGRHQEWWTRFAKRWVVKVLVLASLGFVAWLPFGADRALNVAAALLVVTCPCAIGIAIPLAYELVQSRLRRRGLYVRAPDLLDRLAQVRKVLFDKTGTLTLGRLELVHPDVLRALGADARDAAFNLSARSNHPVSTCLARALEGQGARYDAVAHVEEVEGQGLELRQGGAVWRLGRPSWAAPSATDVHGAALSRDGALVASFATSEALRPDARKEVAALEAGGAEVWLVSGDAKPRVTAMAQALGVPEARALGGLLPEQKAKVVSEIDREDTLYLGDGVNDALAFERALAAGTPTIDRPVMPGRSDFFLVGEGLSPVRDALAHAVHLRRVVKRLLAISLSYNVLAVAACLLGKMSPLAAAITMPASTVTLLLITIWSLKPRLDAEGAVDAAWRASPSEAAA